MQTHKITLSYPTSGLTVNMEIRNRTTNAVLETGVAVENGTTATYDYDFEGADNVDYIYIATVSGLNTMKGAVYYTTSGGGSGGGLTTDEHNHLMSLSQFSGGGIIDRTKNNKDLIDKIAEFEKIINKIPFFDVKVLEALLNTKIGNIKPVDVSGIKTELSNLTIAITAQKSVLLDIKNKEKQELMQELKELEAEKQSILDKFDNFNENLKEKDSLLTKKQYDIDEKNKKISELERQIQQIEFEKESEKNKAEETINELLELHKGEIEEKQITEGKLVRAYIDK